MDLLLPDVPVTRAAPRIIDTTGRFSSPLSGTTRTVTRPGDRWGFRLDWENLATVKRARLEGVIANMRGAANRLLVSPVDFPQRGSFPSGELFPNNNFAALISGTWNTEGAGITLTQFDRSIRATRNLYDGTANGLVAPKNQNAVQLTNYLPYVVRFMVRQGRGLAGGFLMDNDGAADGLIGSTATPAQQVWQANQAQAFGLLKNVRIPYTTGGYAFGPWGPETTGGTAGDYYDVDWSSLSQCFLVDNGANLVAFSDQFNSWTASNCSVTANTQTAPDGTTTADSLVEDSATTLKDVNASFAVPSTACDVSFSCAVKAAGRNFIRLQMTHSGGAIAQMFNVSAGALATSTAVQTDWANLRSYISPLGNGWYFCSIVGRKTGTETSITAAVFLASADNFSAYLGNGAAASYAWRGTASQSAFPARLVQSASAPVAAAAQTGTTLYVKGLPPSTAGLLLAGDWVEINLEMKRVTAPLNSDAAGLGYLEFSPPIRTSPNDNDPVITNMPMGRFILSNNQNSWQSVPGPNLNPFGTYSLDVIEASA